MEEEDNFSDEYLRGYNDGYAEAEEDLIESNFSSELNSEQLDLEFIKGKEEGVRFARSALADVLNKYSEIECENDQDRALLVKNQILAIKYALDYIASLDQNTEFSQNPWV